MFTSHNQLSIPGHEFQGSFKVRTLSVNQPGIMAVSREHPFHKISLTRWVHFPLGLTANESCHFCSSWLCVYSTVQRALRRATDFIQNRRHWCQQTVAEAKQTNICRCIHMAHNVHVCHIDDRCMHVELQPCQQMRVEVPYCCCHFRKFYLVLRVHVHMVL